MFCAGWPGTIKSIRFRKGWKKIKARRVPVTLKATWTAAVRFAFTLAPKDDITASTVEPILLPRTIAAPSTHGRDPFAERVRTIAVVAEDE